MRSPLPVLALAALALGATACSPSFDVHVSSKTTVQGSALGQLSQFFPPGAFAGFAGMDLSQTSDFKNAGISKDQVSSVKLKSLTLKIVSPSGATFDWLNSIKFNVTTDGQPTKEVAKDTSVSHSASSLSLAVDDVELAPYVTAPRMSLTTDANAVQPSEDTQIEADAVFTVVPKIL